MQRHPTNGSDPATDGVAAADSVCTIVYMREETQERLRRGAAGTCRTAGFTMIEVLVAIIVLSFGVLGTVGLQGAALKYGRDARQQSVAVSLARELAEMMRANAAESSQTTANPYLGSFSGTGLAPATTSSCLSPGNQCGNTLDVANAQMTDWLSRVEAALPDARVVTCEDTAPYDAKGLPQWDCTAPGSSAQSVTVIKLGWTRETTKAEIKSSGDARPFVVLPIISE